MKKRQILCLLIAASIPISISAQSWLKNLEKKAKNAVQQIDKAIDAVTPNENKSADSGKSQEKVTESSSTQKGNIDLSNISEQTYTLPHLTANTRYVHIPSRANTDRKIKDGMIRVSANDYNGYFNSKGEQIFDYEWMSGSFDNGACIVRQKTGGYGTSKYAILYKNGTYRDLPQSYVTVTDFIDGVALASLSHGVSAKVKTEIIYIDTNGKNIYKNLTYQSSSTIAPSIPGPFHISEGLRVYYDFDKKKYGYIDTSGNIVIPAQFFDAGPFGEGLAAVAVKEVSWNQKEWGFIDKTGRVVLTLDPEEFPLQYENGKDIPTRFNSGYCPVYMEIDRKNIWYYIDKTGKKVSSEYERAFPFYDGYAMIRNFESEKRRSYEKYSIIINTSFKPVSQNRNFGVMAMPAYSDGLIRINEDGSSQDFIEPNGIIVLKSGSYEHYISNFDNGLAYCLYTIGGKQLEGIINKKGEFEVVFTNSRDLASPHTVPEAKKIP